MVVVVVMVVVAVMVVRWRWWWLGSVGLVSGGSGWLVVVGVGR